MKTFPAIASLFLILLSLPGPCPAQSATVNPPTVHPPTVNPPMVHPPMVHPPTARENGIIIGTMEPGSYNAITDVEGVKVGHVTRIEGESVRTGVTAILPHAGNLFMNKVPASIFVGNGFGKLTGYTQVRELGNIETPVILTNTLSVPVAAGALITHTLAMEGNEKVRSVNPVVGETNDGTLNDIRSRVVTEGDVLEAIRRARGGRVAQGNVGAGTGTICFGYKGGIGTSSRRIRSWGGGMDYTLGVLVQSNFGGQLTIAGVPVGRELAEQQTGSRDSSDKPASGGSEDAAGRGAEDASARGAEDGSCMIVIATDAPLTSRNLERLAERALLGLGRAGGIMSNGSGDYVIAFSTAKELRIPHASESPLNTGSELRNEAMSILFRAVVEATEEAIINSLFAAETMTGHGGVRIGALPVDRTLDILKLYNRAH